MAKPVPPQLLSIVGSWSGNCRLWFEPGKLADESPISGVIEAVPGTSVLRHRYVGSVNSKPHQGEEWIVFNALSGQCEVSWIDDFHMNYGILQSSGPLTEHGYSVFGEYAVGLEHPKWGWRTDLNVLNENEIEFLAYNRMPASEDALAVHIQYQRLRS